MWCFLSVQSLVLQGLSESWERPLIFSACCVFASLHSDRFLGSRRQTGQPEALVSNKRAFPYLTSRGRLYQTGCLSLWCFSSCRLGQVSQYHRTEHTPTAGHWWHLALPSRSLFAYHTAGVLTTLAPLTPVLWPLWLVPHTLLALVTQVFLGLSLPQVTVVYPRPKNWHLHGPTVSQAVPVLCFSCIPTDACHSCVKIQTMNIFQWQLLPSQFPHLLSKAKLYCCIALSNHFNFYHSSDLKYRDCFLRDFGVGPPCGLLIVISSCMCCFTVHKAAQET